MKRRYQILICFLLSFLPVFAQKGIVLSGIVLDAESKPLEGANVALYDERDSSLVVGIATDKRGAFRIECAPLSRSYLHVSFLGYKEQTQGLINVRENLDLGKILMLKDEIQMEGVEVVASQQTRLFDRVIVYPAVDQVKVSPTSFDLLSNMMLPGLDVNVVERTAKYMDKTVEFRVNGRKVTVQEVDALTSNEIEKVEYIDSPGLEYGPGVGAVVNYVTKEPVSGFILSTNLMNALYVGFGNDNVNMRWNHKDSEFGLSYQTSFRKYRKRSNDRTEGYYFPDGREIVREYVGEDTPFKSQYHTVALSYNLLKKDDYMFSVIGRFTYDYSYRNYLTNLYENKSSLGRQSSFDDKRNLLPELDLYFSKQLTPKQSLSVNVVGGYNDSEFGYWYREKADGDYFTSFTAEGSRYNLIGEVKYQNNFHENHKVLFGARDKLFLEDDHYSSETGTRETDNNDFYFYGDVSGKFNKFFYHAALAGTASSYRQGGRDFTFWSFEPFVYLSYRPSSRSMFFAQLNVMSTDPVVSNMNDVTQVINPYLLSRGNPDLSPYTTYEVLAGYDYTGKRLTFELMGAYEHRHEPITDHIYYDNQEDVFVNSYLNQGAMKRYDITACGKYTGLFNKILTLSARLRYNHYETTGLGYRHHLNVFSAQLEALATYKDFSFSITGNTRNKSLLGERLSYPELYSTALIQYRKDNCFIGLGMYYPFAKQWDAGTDVLSAIAPQKSWTKIKENGRMLFVRFSWSFSTGRKYQGGQKNLNNQGGRSSLSSMPVID